MNENYFLNSYRYLQNVSEVVITLTVNKFVSFHRMDFISNPCSLGKRLFIVPHTTLKCSSLEPSSMEDVGVRFRSQISRISMKIMKHVGSKLSTGSVQNILRDSHLHPTTKLLSELTFFLLDCSKFLTRRTFLNIKFKKKVTLMLRHVHDPS